MDTSKFQHLPEGFKDVMNASANAVFLDNDYNNVYTNRNLYETFNTSDPKEVMRKLVEKRKKHDYRGIGIGDHFTLPPFESLDGNIISDAQIQIAGFDHYKHEPSYKELPIEPFSTRCTPKNGFFCKVSDSIVLSYGYMESGSAILKSIDGGKTWSTYTLLKDIRIDTMASKKLGANNYEVYIYWQSKQIEVVSTDVTSQNRRAISRFSVERLTTDEISIEETIESIVLNVTSDQVWFLHTTDASKLYWVVGGHHLYDDSGTEVYSFTYSDAVKNIISIKNSQGYADSYLICTSTHFYEMSFSSNTPLRTWNSSNTAVGYHNDSAFKNDDSHLYAVIKKNSIVFDTFHLYDEGIQSSSWTISSDSSYTIQCVPDVFLDRFLILSYSGILSYPYTACGATKPNGTLIGGDSIYTKDSVVMPIQDGADRRILTIYRNTQLNYDGSYAGMQLHYIEKTYDKNSQHSYITALELPKDLRDWNWQGDANSRYSRQFLKVRTNSPVNFFAQISYSALKIVSSFRENFKTIAYMSTSSNSTIGCVYVEGRDVFTGVVSNYNSSSSGIVRFKNILDLNDTVLFVVAPEDNYAYIFTTNKKCYCINFSYYLIVSSNPYDAINEISYPFQDGLTNWSLVSSGNNGTSLLAIADQGLIEFSYGSLVSHPMNFSEPIVRALYLGSEWNSQKFIILSQTKFHFMNASFQITSSKLIPSKLRNLDFISLRTYGSILNFSAYKGSQLLLGKILDLELNSMEASSSSTEETTELSSLYIIQKEGKLLYVDWMDRKSSDEQINLVLKIKGNPNSYMKVLSCLDEFEITPLHIAKTIRTRFDGYTGTSDQGERVYTNSDPVQIIRAQECFFMNTNWASHRMTMSGSGSTTYLTITATDFSILPLFRLNPNARKIGAVWQVLTMVAGYSTETTTVLVYPDGDTTIYYSYGANHKLYYETQSKSGDLLVFSI